MISILLADDHSLIRDGLKALLTPEAGYDIVGEAGDGITAVELAARLKPDVAIVDISLPKLNGIRVTNSITEQPSAPKVIVLSMHTEGHFVRDALRAGASGYVLKDAAFEELRTAITAVLKGGTYLTPTIAGAVTADYSGGGDTSALTRRELEVLTEIAKGRSTKEVAEVLNVSPKTVESHRRNLMDKLGLHTIAELTRYAIQQGLTPL